MPGLPSSIPQGPSARNAGESAIIKFREQSVSGNPGEFGEAQQYTGQRLNYWITVLN